jgi:hypothetical protein
VSVGRVAVTYRPNEWIWTQGSRYAARCIRTVANYREVTATRCRSLRGLHKLKHVGHLFVDFSDQRSLARVQINKLSPIINFKLVLAIQRRSIAWMSDHTE